MTRPDIRPVVVGVDHTVSCLPAVRVAARHAAAQGVPLLLVHALTPHTTATARRRPDPTLVAEEAARNEVPELIIRHATVPGSAEFVLLTEANRASLVVIGHRGVGARAGRLVGSLATRLAGRTTCPLLIVHRTGDANGPVVVGVDDPPASDGILREAFRQARILSRPLQVVHAWHLAVPALAGPPATYGHELFGMFQEEAVAGEIERIALDFPDVAVTAEVREGHDRATLIAATDDAALLVVGAHRNVGLSGLVLGTTAMSAAQQAACPVLVVPAGRAAR